jgi:hypothetical protein
MFVQKNSVISLLLLSLSGCASIVSDSTSTVTLTSIPDRADFAVINQRGKVVHSGTTPATVTLKTAAGYFKGEKYQLKLQKEGYGPQSAPLYADVNNWYWGNFLFGGPIGLLVVDPLTGAMWSLPESKTVVLTPRQ